MFDAVQGFEDRAARQGFAVALAPLDVANPDRHTGQFGGKGVDLDAQNVVWSGLHDQLGGQPQFLGLDADKALHIAQGFEGQVQEISRPAGGVQHAETAQA